MFIHKTTLLNFFIFLFHLEYKMALNKITKSTSYDVLKSNEPLSLGEQA